MAIPAFSSSSSLSNETRVSIQRLQARLVEAQKELGSGRHADVGLELGADTGKVITFRQELSVTQAIIDANGITQVRLESSQIALRSIADLAQEFLAALVNTKTATGVAETTSQEAKAGLKAFLDLGNTTVEGQYIFSGVNSDVRPFDDYFATPPPASRQAYTAAFLAKFGIDPDDPAVSSILPADMTGFLDVEAAAQFADPAWTGNWSSASDKNIKSRISRMDIIETSVNANSAAFRDIAAAFVAVADSGFASLNDSARRAVMDKAIAQLGSGISGLAELQSHVGIAEERLSRSNDILVLQQNLFTSSIDRFEGVDAAEVSARIADLMTQIETAYAITSRLHNLSLLNYLSR